MRFRIAAWNAAAMLAILFALLIWLRVGLRQAVLHELDGRLIAAGEDVGRMLDRHVGGPSAVQPLIEQWLSTHQGESYFVRVRDPGGSIWYATRGAPDLSVLPPPGPPITVDRWRTVTQEHVCPDGSRWIVRIGLPMENYWDDLSRVDQRLAWGAVVAAVAAPLIGFWLAGQALRPIQDMMLSAKTMRPDNLTDRLPDRGTGDELDQLSATINGYLDRLGQDMARRRDFLANAAHELRTPLAGIRAAVDVGLSKERSADEFRTMLGELVEQCDSLTGLINQLLLLAESDAGRIAPGRQSLDMAECIRTTVDLYQPWAESAGVQLTATAESVVVGGVTSHLQSLMGNLIDNAVKHTPPGGQVEVTLKADGDWAVAAVKDTGVGISADSLPKVRERFYRSPDSRARYTGNGLGLSICDAMVQSYGGQLEIVSRPGHGTTATVRLPRKEAHLTKM